MAQRRGGPIRTLRIAALAGAVVVLTTLAHLLGGASAVPTGGVVVLTLLSLPFAAVLTARQLGWRSILLFIGLGQAVGHVVLMTGPIHIGLQAPQHAGGVGMSGMYADLAGMADMPTGMGLSPAMIGWHLIASVLVTAALARGERLAWRVRSLWQPLPGEPAELSPPAWCPCIAETLAIPALLPSVLYARGPPVTQIG